MKGDKGSYSNGFPISAVSDTGLISVKSPDKGRKKEVGLFYFVWIGADAKRYQTKNYCNRDILKNLPDPVTHQGNFTLEEWRTAGGGGPSQFHFWDEPMFGRYDSGDQWVVDRHVRMFIQAGIDYLVLDFTNGVYPDYVENTEGLFRVLDKYHKQGFKVPQVAIMAYDDGPRTVNELYQRLYLPHPEFAHLFYHWNGNPKPVIFDNISGYSKHATFQIDPQEKLASYAPGVTDFFQIRDQAFPHETKVPYHNFPDVSESFLYLDFRPEPKKVTDKEGYSYINISLSEIEETNAAASQWYKNTKDRSRSWDGQCNRHWLPGEENASDYGYNFARQFNIALEADPDNIFITGWNEWIAQLQVRSDQTTSLVDNADYNNSRDIEPMKGGYKDNYFIQLCHFVARFKGLAAIESNRFFHNININGSMSQWNEAGIPAHIGYSDAIQNRDSHQAYDFDKPLIDTSGRNDLVLAKACDDEENFYFYIKTGEDLKAFRDKGAMTLFISLEDRPGYEVAVNRIEASADAMVVEKNTDGSWKEIGSAEYNARGNELMVAISKKLLDHPQKIGFKWADNYDEEDDLSFYTRGSTLPYGKMNLIYKI